MEQAVIVFLKLSNQQFGAFDEREALFELEDHLADAIAQHNAGEFDGDEIGEGECRIFMYGPNADNLYSSIEPVLKTSTLAAHGYALKRYGEPEDPNVRKVRVTWS
jgi:hypothetical protein